MADSPEEIKKAVKLYIFIGAFLFAFTIITVAVATVPALDFGGRGFDAVDATIGLAIAAFKASLVMLIFMHLNHEKKLVYFVYILGFIFAIFLMVLTGLTLSGDINYGEGDTQKEKTGFYSPPAK